MGLIVSNELIGQADDLGDKFDTATQIIGVQFEEALVNLAPLLVSTAGGIAEIARQVGGMVDQFKAIGDRTVLAPLQTNLVNLENQIATLKADIASQTASTLG